MNGNPWARLLALWCSPLPGMPGTAAQESAVSLFLTGVSASAVRENTEAREMDYESNTTEERGEPYPLLRSEEFPTGGRLRSGCGRGHPAGTAPRREPITGVGVSR